MHHISRRDCHRQEAQTERNSTSTNTREKTTLKETLEVYLSFLYAMTPTTMRTTRASFKNKKRNVWRKNNNRDALVWWWHPNFWHHPESWIQNDNELLKNYTLIQVDKYMHHGAKIRIINITKWLQEQSDVSLNQFVVHWFTEEHGLWRFMRLEYQTQTTHQRKHLVLNDIYYI